MNVDWCMVILQPPRYSLKFAVLHGIIVLSLAVAVTGILWFLFYLYQMSVSKTFQVLE